MLKRVKTSTVLYLAATALTLAGGASLHAGNEPRTRRAAEITMLRAEGPAERAGLALHDLILEVNGTSVTDRPALLRALGDLGDRAVLLVRSGRTGEERCVKVRPDPRLGIHFKIVAVPVQPPPR